MNKNANFIFFLSNIIIVFSSEQIDTLKLALHFRDRFKQVSKENADLASRFLEMSEVAELVKQRLAVVRSVLKIKLLFEN